MVSGSVNQKYQQHKFPSGDAFSEIKTYSIRFKPLAAMSLYKKRAISLAVQILRSAQDDYYLYSVFKQFFKNLPKTSHIERPALQAPKKIGLEMVSGQESLRAERRACTKKGYSLAVQILRSAQDDNYSV